METLASIYNRHRVTGPDVGHGDKAERTATLKNTNGCFPRIALDAR